MKGFLNIQSNFFQSSSIKYGLISLKDEDKQIKGAIQLDQIVKNSLCMYVKILRVKSDSYRFYQVSRNIIWKRRKGSTNMDNVSNVEKSESIKSLQSTISKLENALSQMTQKGANTTLVKKRLKAVCIGLAVLENVWNQSPHYYSQAELADARNVLTGLFPSIENVYVKSKAGSPQKTLLERRIKALELAVQAIHVENPSLKIINMKDLKTNGI